MCCANPQDRKLYYLNTWFSIHIYHSKNNDTHADVRKVTMEHRILRIEKNKRIKF